MSELYEPLLAFIAAQLSRPVIQREEPNGILVLTGDPPEIIVRFTPGTVVVAEYSIKWEEPHTAVIVPITIGSVIWTRLPEEGAMRGAQGADDGRPECAPLEVPRLQHLRPADPARVDAG